MLEDLVSNLNISIVLALCKQTGMPAVSRQSHQCQDYTMYMTPILTIKSCEEMYFAKSGEI